jgi:hypothetical protein
MHNDGQRQTVGAVASATALAHREPFDRLTVARSELRGDQRQALVHAAEAFVSRLSESGNQYVTFVV